MLATNPPPSAATDTVAESVTLGGPLARTKSPGCFFKTFEMNSLFDSGLQRELCDIKTVSLKIMAETRAMKSTAAVAATETALVSVSFNVNALSKLKVRLLALRNKASQEFTAASAADITLISETHDQMTTALLALRSVSLWHTLGEAGCNVWDMLADILSDTPQKQAMYGRTAETLRSRSVKLAVTEPSKCGFAVLLQKAALQAEDATAFQRGTFAEIAATIFERCADDGHSAMVPAQHDGVLQDDCWVNLWNVLFEECKYTCFIAGLPGLQRHRRRWILN